MSGFYTWGVTKIETYVGEKQHEKGSRKTTGKGWVVTNTVSSVPRRGCIGFILLGLFRKKTRFVVTFARPD